VLAHQVEDFALSGRDVHGLILAHPS